MQTGCAGVRGNCPRYVCARARQLYGGEKGCQSIGGRRLEQRVLSEVFAVLEPAALAATAQALADAEYAHAATRRAFELTVERARLRGRTGSAPIRRGRVGEPARRNEDVVVTVAEAERLLGVGKVTIYWWLPDGFIVGEQLTANAPLRIRIDQAVRDRVVPKVPDGWVGLDEAATILGVARQTVLHEVQRGEL